MNSYLLDTSILSVLGNPQRPQYALVRHWYQAHDESRLFTCAVVVGEIARGIARLPDGIRKQRYASWLRDEVAPFFGERILPFDAVAGERWGLLMGEAERRGAVPPSDDAKIAAVAALHGMMVVTGNVRHFDGLGVAWLNPIDGSASNVTPEPGRP